MFSPFNIGRNLLWFLAMVLMRIISKVYKFKYFASLLQYFAKTEIGFYGVILFLNLYIDV